MSQYTSSFNPLKLALICGGPSLERGISLNSARSLLDHLSSRSIEISVFYVTQSKEWYTISPFHLYSNTPADFDFKLKDIGQILEGDALISALKNIDIVFPAIHGAYGEDGELQAFLEKHQIPFVGPSSQMCQMMFHKHNAAFFLKENGFKSLPSCLLKKKDPDNIKKIQNFFEEHRLTRGVVKPVAGGSSIGVSSVLTPEDAFKQMLSIFEHPLNQEALLESFCKGKEFTIVVLQNPQGEAVSLIPNEIQISYENGQIFDYRRKYLPTSNTKWLCPPSFGDEIVKDIQKKAQDLFTLFGLRDFVRMDGWFLENGDIVFTDFNPISGMEQNSFLFLQAAYVGMKHQEVLTYIVKNACQRYGLEIPLLKEKQSLNRHPVWVVFGGNTAERQVSVMSGTNVWLKLMKSEFYDPQPFFLDFKGHIWKIPYVYCLHHTAEEIYENCLTSHAMTERLDQFVTPIRKRLGLNIEGASFMQEVPEKLTFSRFIEDASHEKAFIFLGLHGGSGEDGTYQELLEDAKLFYNGSGPEASQLCMDKYMTGLSIEKMGHDFIKSLPKKIISLQNFENFTRTDYEIFWQNLLDQWSTSSLIIKPKDDGCSAGVVRLETAEELEKYLILVRKGVSAFPQETFSGQKTIIELNPGAAQSEYILEPFITTDILTLKDNHVFHTPVTGWLEITAGVLEHKGIYHAMNPSLTVSESHVLNVEEKFQGGTGVNITPPPAFLISNVFLAQIKERIEKVAQALGIKNYARIDCFANRETGELIVIEANSLPALTPSTVFYHQGLAETPPLSPRMLLEYLIRSKQEN
ncbi:MAG: hypothetical protein JSS34_06600 [Proteobacteria bacterium]|nr:hypothetical protein [Pseudomonadota bacterium]